MTRRTIAALVLVALTASGCKLGGSKKAGAGESLGVCAGYRTYNALPEPDLTNAAAVKEHLTAVLRVFDRIRTDSSFTDLAGKSQPVPASVVTNLAATKAAYRQLLQTVTAAGTPAALANANSAFAADPTFSSADTALELWVANECG